MSIQCVSITEVSPEVLDACWVIVDRDVQPICFNMQPVSKPVLPIYSSLALLESIVPFLGDDDYFITKVGDSAKFLRTFNSEAVIIALNPRYEGNEFSMQIVE